MDSQIDRPYLFGKENWNLKPNFFNLLISSEVQIKFQNLKSPRTTESYFLVFPDLFPHIIYLCYICVFAFTTFVCKL